MNTSALQTGNYILAKIAIISSTFHGNSAGTSQDGKGVKKQNIICTLEGSQRSPWRNRLARSAVRPKWASNRKVGGSSPPGDDYFSCFFLLNRFSVTKPNECCFRNLLLFFFFLEKFGHKFLWHEQRINVKGVGTLFQSGGSLKALFVFEPTSKSLLWVKTNI